MSVHARMRRIMLPVIRRIDLQRDGFLAEMVSDKPGFRFGNTGP